MVIDPEEHRRNEGRTPKTASNESSSVRSRSVAVPFATRVPSEPGRVAPLARRLDSAQVVWARWANWMVGVWASVFSLIAAGGYLYHRGQLAEIAAEHLRLMVTGPARLATDVAQRYTARTTTVTGHALPAQVEFAVYGPDDALLIGHKETADERGEVHVVLRPDARWPANVRMVVVATYSSRTERAETELTVVSPGHRTALSLFPPVCRGGETLRYRSLSLASHSLGVDRELPIRFAIRDPKGDVLPDSIHEGLTVRGAGWGQFTLPRQAAEGVYWLCATSLDDSFPEVRRPFTVRPDRAGNTKPSTEGIHVRFRPEGGVLVSAVENRVYFLAWEGEGRPARISGRIVDRQDRPVAALESTQDGLGSVQFEPQPGEQYRLQLDRDPKEEKRHGLPPVSANHSAVLTMGLGVIEPRAPLEFNVRASAAGLPLVATAFCRGVQVGQQTLVTSVGANPVSIALPDGLAGTLRLRLHEYRSNPPKLLGERLVYRRPAQHLEVRATVEQASLRPGGKLNIPIRVADEQGRPVTAGLSVASWFFPSPAKDQPKAKQESQRGDPLDSFASGGAQEARSSGSGNAERFCLAPELLIWDELDRLTTDDDSVELFLRARLANMLHVPSLPAAETGNMQALDLLLGALGPTVPPTQQDAAKPPARTAENHVDCPPPTMFDNLQYLLERYQASLTAYRVNRTRVLNALTTMSLFGGVGLVMFVAMLSLLNVPCGVRLWAPALTVATACILIGVVLSDPERLKRNPGGDVAFALQAPQGLPMPKAAPSAAHSAGGGGPLRPFSPPSRATKPAEPPLASHAGPTLILWEPFLVTDASGQTSVQIETPAHAGALQIVVDAHAGGGRFGSFRSPLLSSADPAREAPRAAGSP